MSELGANLLFGLLISVPMSALMLALALWLDKAASSYQDRIWMLAQIMTALPLLGAGLVSFLTPFLQPEVVLPVLGDLPEWSQVVDLPAVMAEQVDRAGFTVPVWFMIWMVGATVAGLVQLRHSLKLWRLLAEAQDLPQTQQARISQRLAAVGLQARVLTGPDLAGPVVCGVFRHTFLLPEGFKVDEAGLAILDHEIAHARRQDVRTALCMRILGVVFWFNPVWRILETRRQIAVEMACDAYALNRLDPGMARSYARALLDTVRADSGFAHAVGFGVTHKEALKMRLSSILSPSPKPKLGHLLTGLLCAGVLITGSAGMQLAHATGLSLTKTPEFTHMVLQGRFTSAFGVRNRLPDLPQAHGGVDVAAPVGTPINAPAAGQVAYVGNGYQGNPAWGHVIVLDHGGGWTTIYAHLGAMNVSVGERVRPGQPIAEIGLTGRTTGPHVHIELRQNGERVDPALYLPGLETGTP